MENGEWVLKVRAVLESWCWPAMSERRVEFYCVPGELLAGVQEGAVSGACYDGRLVLSEWAVAELVIARIVAPAGLEVGETRWGWQVDEQGVAWAEYRPGAVSAELYAELGE